MLQILPNFGLGGAERMVVHLMLNLDPERFEVGAVSLYDPSDTHSERSLAQGGVPVWYLGKRRGPDPRMFARIAAVIRRFRPHVVHTHRYVLRYTLPLPSYRRLPALVHTVHNVAERELDHPRTGRWIHHLAFCRGVVPVAIGQEVTSSIIRVYGLNDFPTIPHGITVGEYRNPSTTREAWRREEEFASGDVLFACVARFSLQKNHARLLEAFARGPASDPRARLLLVGKGRLQSEVEKRARDLGLRDKVRFLGLRTDIPEILNAADVFVLSSDWEGNPLSIMEAMSAGKPVISTAVGGVPELVEDGKTGLLIPPGDVESLAQAMRYLLEDSEARTSMGKASVQAALRRFDVAIMAKTYGELYETMVLNG